MFFIIIWALIALEAPSCLGAPCTTVTDSYTAFDRQMSHKKMAWSVLAVVLALVLYAPLHLSALPASTNGEGEK